MTPLCLYGYLKVPFTVEFSILSKTLDARIIKKVSY